MKTLPPYILEEKNAVASQYPFVILLDITLISDTGNSYLYLTPNTDNIIFNSNTYTRFPMQIDAKKDEAKGSLSTLDIKVSNVKRILESTIENMRGAVGSSVRVRIVSTKYLDTPTDYSELEIIYDIVQTAIDSMWVTFTLGAPYITRQRFPLYMYLGNYCEWLPYYAVAGMECNYSGDLLECNGTFEDCEYHQNTANFGGHLGLVNINFRLA